MKEIDIWRCAQLLLARHGTEAVSIATRRADELLNQGDAPGCSTWLRISKAITDLEHCAPGKGDKVH